MDLSSITTEEFIFQSMMEGFMLSLVLSLVWWPVGAGRAWVRKMLE